MTTTKSILILMILLSSIGITSAEYTTEQIGYNPQWDKTNYYVGDIAEIIISFNANYFDNTKYFYEVSIRNPNTGYSDIYNITIPEMRIEYPFDAPGTYDMDVFVSDRTDINQGLILSHSYREVALMPLVYHAPTATATPEITPTPTPSPTPTPKPTPIILEITANSTPTTTPTPAPQQISTSQYGTLNFISEPSNASIYINGEKMREVTPTRRDLSPKGYIVTISKPGYVNFSRNVIVRDMDNVDINVKLEPEIVTIPDEQPKEVSLNMVIPEQQNTTRNNSSATTATPGTATNNGITATILAFLGGMAVCAIVAVGLFGIPKNSVANGGMPHGTPYMPVGMPQDMPEDANEISVADTQEKILGLLRHEPKYTQKEMANKLRIPDRTFARRIQDMKKEGLI